MSRRRNRKPKIAQATRHSQSVPCTVLTFEQMYASFPPTLWAMVWQAYRLRPPCLLCQKPCYRVGAFIPTEPQAWGIPPGWRGGCVYSLCQTCVQLPDLMACVEALLWQDRAEVVAPWN